MKKPFCCEASRLAYEDYYLQQSGNGLSVFQGARLQRGHGIGSFLSGLFRSAWPLIQTGAKALGKHALRTGLQIANDVADGDHIVEAAKRRVPEGIKAFTSSNNFNTQSGSGGKRRKRSLRRRNKKRVKEDIFGVV
jgi:hypothetical protein